MTQPIKDEILQQFVAQCLAQNMLTHEQVVRVCASIGFKVQWEAPKTGMIEVEV